MRHCQCIEQIVVTYSEDGSKIQNSQVMLCSGNHCLREAFNGSAIITIAPAFNDNEGVSMLSLGGRRE